MVAVVAGKESLRYGMTIWLGAESLFSTSGYLRNWRVGRPGNIKRVKLYSESLNCSSLQRP